MFCALMKKKKRKWSIKFPKTLSDCKKIYDEDGQWRYVIIGLHNEPICLLQTYEDAQSSLDDYWKECCPVKEIIDLRYWDKNYWEKFTEFEGYLQDTNQKITGICEKVEIRAGCAISYIRKFTTKETLKECRKIQRLELSNGEVIKVYKCDNCKTLIEC